MCALLQVQHPTSRVRPSEGYCQQTGRPSLRWLSKPFAFREFLSQLPRQPTRHNSVNFSQEAVCLAITIISTNPVVSFASIMVDQLPSADRDYSSSESEIRSIARSCRIRPRRSARNTASRLTILSDFVVSVRMGDGGALWMG